MTEVAGTVSPVTWSSLTRGLWEAVPVACGSCRRGLLGWSSAEGRGCRLCVALLVCHVFAVPTGTFHPLAACPRVGCLLPARAWGKGSEGDQQSHALPVGGDVTTRVQVVKQRLRPVSSRPGTWWSGPPAFCLRTPRPAPVWEPHQQGWRQRGAGGVHSAGH